MGLCWMCASRIHALGRMHVRVAEGGVAARSLLRGWARTAPHGAPLLPPARTPYSVCAGRRAVHSCTCCIVLSTMRLSEVAGVPRSPHCSPAAADAQDKGD